MQTVCHIAMLPHEQAKKYGNRTVFEYQDFGSEVWKTATWEDFSENVKRVSDALLCLGVGVQEKIGVFSQNILPYIYTDFGAYGIRAVTVPFYATSSENQLQYVINDAEIRFIFVGEQEQYDKARRVQAVCSTLERIIIYDHAVTLADHDSSSMYFNDFMRLAHNMTKQQELNERWSGLNEEDLLNILYTSGTTGESKGVMLSAGQFAAALKANDECVPLTEQDRVITFLPITHIFERCFDSFSLS